MACSGLQRVRRMVLISRMSSTAHAACFTVFFCRNVASFCLRPTALLHQSVNSPSWKSDSEKVGWRQPMQMPASRVASPSWSRSFWVVGPCLSAKSGASVSNKKKLLALDKMLQQQGFGTRKECSKLVQEGLVLIGGKAARDANAKIEVYDGMKFGLGEDEFEYREKAYVIMNKPAGYECTSKDGGHHPTVFDLMPWQIQDRGVQCVGRLDLDTTGMLILTDDGPTSHTLQSPKKQKKKIYKVTCKHAVEDDVIDKLLKGVRLKDSPDEITTAEGAERISENQIRMTITEGKYHQVKRMIAAAGNRVEVLHREAVGGLALPEDVSLGDWRYLTHEELDALLE